MQSEFDQWIDLNEWPRMRSWCFHCLLRAACHEIGLRPDGTIAGIRPEVSRCPHPSQRHVAGRTSETRMTITKYEMPENLKATAYCLFPPALEDDPLVLFHATPIKNFDAIDSDGFKIPNPDGRPGGGLQSVSFSKRSSASLDHAVTKRRTYPGDYCVFAVRYEKLDRPGIADNPSDIHDCTLNPAPEIIGYCVIPATYVHR